MNNFFIKIQNKKIVLASLAYLSLLIGFFYNENSSGGSEKDFNYTYKFILAISENIVGGLNLMIDLNFNHFPLHYLFIGTLLKIFKEIWLVKFIYLNFSLIIPLVLYKCLSITVKNKNAVFYITLLLFFSPYFRSSAIWSTTDNTGILFFLLSILYFLKITILNQTKTKNFILLITFLFLAFYTRQYYVLFYFFYIFIIFKKKILNKKVITIITFFSFILTIPGIYYIYLLRTGKLITDFYSDNFINNLLIFLSIILFYLIPFLIFSKKNIISILSLLKVYKLYFIFVIIVFYFLSKGFNYDLNPHGGGVFYQGFKKYFELSFFYLLSPISLFLIYFFFRSNLTPNILLLIIIFSSFFFNVIFQKYFDPLLLILFFTLFKSENIKNKYIMFEKKYIYYYLYFFLFYILCIIK